MAGVIRLATRFTSGRRASLVATAGLKVETPELLAATDTVRSEGFVLARKVGYDDWVRRPAAIDAMAVPPINPVNRTMLR
jgi:hypothetical protein